MPIINPSTSILDNGIYNPNANGIGGGLSAMGGGSSPPPSSDSYVAEDGVSPYVAENGTDFYVTEGSSGLSGQSIGLLLALTYA